MSKKTTGRIGAFKHNSGNVADNRKHGDAGKKYARY
jgi:hypothetical protein